MKSIRRWLVNLVLKHYLESFEVPFLERELSEGEWAAAANDVYTSKEMQKMINIRIANLIRKNLYIKDMEENAFWRGQVFSLRWLQAEGQKWKTQQEEQETAPKLDSETKT